MKKNDMNSRVLIAVMISFIFIVAYSYIFQNPNKQKNIDIKELQESTKDSLDNRANQPQVFKKSMPKTSQSIISRIVSDSFEVDIDYFGRISQVYLKDKRFTAPKQEGIFMHLGRLFGLAKGTREPLDKLALFDLNAVLPLELRFDDPLLNDEAGRVHYKASNSNIVLQKGSKESQKLILTQTLSNVVVTKTITFYYDAIDNLKYDVHIDMSTPQGYYLSSGQRPIADDDGYAFHGVVLKQNGINGTIEKIEDKNGKNQAEIFTRVPFVSASDRYFTTLLFTRDTRGVDVQVVGEAVTKNPIPYIMLHSNVMLEGYIGAKDYRDLQKVYEPLSDVVDYGIITFFAKPLFLLLDFLYSIFGNWGWAIIILTFIVRLVLFPLSYKGIMSMQKLKDLMPKMKEIQEEYKGDPQKLQVHMMQLYKKHGANPLGGCLPLILQIPVFFAIYRVLYNAVELKNAEWIFWIQDLSVMDPYLVLPILMGLSMYIQQALTPTTLDPIQTRIFKLLPIIFTIFLITFPAGLVLYWTVNNIFAIFMQLMINRILEVKKQREIDQHKHKGDDKNEKNNGRYARTSTTKGSK